MSDERSRTWRTLPALLLAVSTLGVILGVCASANADPPPYQCPPSVAGCTTVVGGWIDVPPGSPATPGLARDQLACPSGLPVGFTYEGGGQGVPYVTVQIWPGYPNWTNVWNPLVNRIYFWIINDESTTTTVRDRIGCAPMAAAPQATADPRRVQQQERVWTVTIHRSQVRSYTHSCASGTRLVSDDATVEFLTKRRPSLTQLTAVTWSAVRHNNRVTIRVNSNSRLPRRGAKLEAMLFCEAN